MKKKYAAAMLLAAACGVHAQTAALESSNKSRWHFIGSIGMNFGGDEIFKGTYTDGSTFSIKAGTGTAFAAGVSYSLTDNVDLQVNIGQEKTTTAASNGELGFYRLPVELLGFYNYGSNWRLGGGLRMATDAKMKYRHDVAGDGEYVFRQTPGLVLETQYLTARYGNKYGRFGIAARVVLGESFDRDYQTPNTTIFQPNNGSFSGTHTGVSLMYMY